MPARLVPALRRLSMLGCIALAAGAAGAPAPDPAAPTGTATLIEQAERASSRDPAETERLLADALRTLAAQPDVDLEIQARLLLCDHQAERDPAAAQREVMVVNELLPRAHRSALRAGLLACKGEMREYAGDTAGAKAFYEESVEVAEAGGDDKLLAHALFLRGYLRSVKGELATALMDLRRSHQLYLKLDASARVSNALNGIAIVYNRMGDHAQARDYYRQSLKAQAAVGATRDQAVTLHNLGRATENLGDPDVARQNYEAALALSRQVDFPRGEAYAMRGLASLANAAGDGRAASTWLDQAEARIGSAPDQRLRAQLLLQRGIAQRLLQRPADSVASLEKALRIFAAADSRAELAATYGALAATHALNGDWRAAFERQSDFKAESDRLLKLQLDQRFATLKIEFDTAAKERDNVLLQRENRTAEHALAQEQRANRLKVMVIALAAVLLLALSLLAVRQRRTSRAMRSLALTDELTGLPNRRHVLARLQELLDRRDDAGCAVLLADLDHFKRINDEHGHLIGDEVLKALGARLTETVREPVFVGRLGGEEFLVVLPDGDVESARQVGERIREQVSTIETRRWFDGPPLTVSIGVASANRAGDTVSDVLRRADVALYDAKRAGRNRVIALVA
jgi:diguanylate cyclase (GGDEF)-like protein